MLSSLGGLCSYLNEATSFKNLTRWLGFSILPPTSQAYGRLTELMPVQFLKHQGASAVCP